LTNSLKDLLVKVGTGIPEKNLSKVIAGDGCGAVCKITCSWHCREKPGQEIVFETQMG